MSDFWLEDEDVSYVLKPIKQKDIVQAEKKLGVELPNLYKKLIILKNKMAAISNELFSL